MSDYEVLTDEEFAREIRTTQRAVQEMCRKKQVRAFKAAGHWRITREAAEEFKQAGAA